MIPIFIVNKSHVKINMSSIQDKQNVYDFLPEGSWQLAWTVSAYPQRPALYF